MKVSAKNFRMLGSVIAAVLGIALHSSPSAALDEKAWNKLRDICRGQSCQSLSEAFILSGAREVPLSSRWSPWDPPTPEEKAFAEAQARAHKLEEYDVMRQGKSNWWINPSMVEAVSVKSRYQRQNYDDNLYSGSNSSVLYTIRAESEQGTKLVRKFVGNCLTLNDRKDITWLLSEPLLYYLGTSEMDKEGTVIREDNPQNPPRITLQNTDEMYSLRVACYLAYDFPLIKEILRSGSSGDRGATFERPNSTSNLPEPSTSGRVIDLTNLRY